MLRDLRISGFRGLRELAMSGLGRVNLLVGTNNCGKTSVLEAIHILSMPGRPLPLLQGQLRRGELVETVAERQIDVAHLFHGRRLVEHSSFTIAGNGTSGRQELQALFLPRLHDNDLRELVTSPQPDVPSGPKDWVASFLARRRGVQRDLFDDADEGIRSVPTAKTLLVSAWLGLHWSSGPVTRGLGLPVTRSGGIKYRDIRTADDASESDGLASVSFVTTQGLSRDDIVARFESVVLTEDEQRLLHALRTIEPAIERIASVGHHATRTAREISGGLVMMVAGQRIPIGSMGDGIWRLLGIALALVGARGGVLLVDEIDTGLHYSVLVDMWRLVLETARDLDVQVFATTHSRDCYEALAAVTEPGRTEISLQRIERSKLEAIAFSELEIRQAAERGLEVR